MSNAELEQPAKRSIFRWRGVFALGFLLLLAAAGWLMFGERTVRLTLEEAATQALGTQVDVGQLGIDILGTSIALHGIAIADPFDSTRNLVEAASLRLVLEVEPLLEKKLVITNFVLGDVRGGTTRATPARSVAATGFAPRAMRELQRFRAQINVPLLSLTPIDTIKALVLDPTQLRTVQAAVSLEQRAESLRRDVTERSETLLRRDILDSAQALVDRLRGQSARTLGVAGVVKAVADVRRLTARLDSLRRAADALRRDVKLGFDSLTGDVRSLDEARRADYAFARGLLALPTFDAPSIGPALFGDMSLDAVERAMYWVALAREYAPPGLLPRARPGPERLRRAGTTFHFARRANVPHFLLRRGEAAVSLDAGAGAARGEYSLVVANVTSEPALVGQPMDFSFRRTAASSDVRSLTATGSLDHTGDRPHDVVDIQAGDVRLPSFDLPAIPVRAEFGRGRSDLRLDMRGDSLHARWTIVAPSATWLVDSARSGSPNTLERLVMRVIAGIRSVEIEAEILGTVSAPTLSVRSNLDREIAASIKSVAGEEIAKAEQRARLQIDSIADVALAPARARVAVLRAQAETGVAEATRRIDEMKERLAARMKEVGIGGR